MRNNFIKFFLAGIIIFLAGNAKGAVFFSKGSLPPNLLTSWISDTTRGGSNPLSFADDDLFVVRFGHTMITTDVWSISGTNSKLLILNGGVLEAQHQITLSSGTVFEIQNGGKYIHNNQLRTSTIIPPVFGGINNFAPNSTVEILKWNLNAINKKIADFPENITWGNLEMKWYPEVDNWNLFASVSIIHGNFTFDVTGTQYFISLSRGGTSLELTVMGDFIVRNGSMTFTTGQVPPKPVFKLHLMGNYLQTGGSFTHPHQNSPLEFNMRGTGKTYTQSGGSIITSNMNFFITPNASYTLNSNITVASTRSFTVMETGTLDCSVNSINGVGTFSLIKDATLKTAHTSGINGSIAVTGTKTFTSNTTNYVFYGSTAQTAGTLIPDIVNDITFNNSSGVTLSKSTVARNKIILSQGKIRAATFTLTLGVSKDSLGTLEYTSGRIIGKFARWFAATPVSFTLYPLGSEDFYRPVNLRYSMAPTVPGILTAEHIPLDPGMNNTTPINDNGYIIDTYSKRGYWQIVTDGILSGGNYDINLTMQGIVGANNVPQLRIIKRANSLSDWTVDGTHEPATGPSDNPTVKRTGLSGFSQFTIGGNFGNGNPLEGPLPVKLSSFSSLINGRDVTLNWITETEENNSGFEVQRSVAGNQEPDWKITGFVPGKGNSNNQVKYSFTDRNLQTGKYKYRLKQTDYNGNYEYFELAGNVEIGIPAKFNLKQNYPNPFNPTTKIDYEIPEKGFVTLTIYDILGRELAVLVNEIKDAGFYTVDFNAGKLNSGIYIYRLTVNGVSSIKKMMVMK
jgi:hypothetical protein